jgi:hypothetical protein
MRDQGVVVRATIRSGSKSRSLQDPTASNLSSWSMHGRSASSEAG